MPILDLQRRLSRTGAIRLGDQVPTGTVSRDGKPRTRPNKLERFRITGPYRDVIEAAAKRFGGTVRPWRSPTGPEWEVYTTVQSLPVLVPSQRIDPNYEAWGNRIRIRICDGATERLRKTPCLCELWDNHDHRFSRGTCMFCGLAQDWDGDPHEHIFELGVCAICGCRRMCKPTTRVSVMLRGINADGVFKVESHGFNAAQGLPAYADIIAETPVPLPGILVMRKVDQLRLVVDASGERAESRQFWVPELRFPWLTPDMAFAGSRMLEQAARRQLESAEHDQLALTSAASEPDPDDPELTPDDIIELAGKATNQAQVRQLWRDAAHHGAGNDDVAMALTARATELQAASRTEGDDDTLDGEVLDDAPSADGPPPVEDWPPVTPPADAAR